MKQENSAGAVIFYYNKEPHFLLLKYTTYWGFAKGWIESGESEEQAAKREVNEETGLNVSFISGFRKEQRWFYMTKEKVKKHAVFFLAEINKEQSKKIKISDEHEDFKFVTLKQAYNYIKIKSNRELLEKAYDFIQKRSGQKKLF